MPTIRIDDEVWRELQKHAQPLVDSPNDVLRRLLNLNGKRNTLPPGGKIVLGYEYRKPILQYLVKTGGRGNVHDILEVVEHEMKPRLTQKDYEQLSSGPIRWRINAMYERKHMVMEGLLKKDSPHGIWEITEQGKHWLSQN